MQHRIATMSTHAGISFTLITAAALAALPLAGCGGGEGASRTVGLAEFSRAGSRPADTRNENAPDPAATAEATGAAPRASGPSSSPESAGPDEDPAPPIELGAASDPEEDARRRAAAEAIAEAARRDGRRENGRVIVDSLVGQVNGRPIFADEFFVPIEDRLIAIAQQRSRSEFEREAIQIIGQHLHNLILNELFLAEAEANLSTEQRQGLVAMMRYWQEETIAQRGGTRSSAERRLAETEGMTVSEFLEMQRDRALLQELRRRKIEPRITVSWRDIEREYQRRFHEFNPPAEMKISRIRLHTRNDAESIEEVKQRLDAGEAFAEIAEATGHEEGGRWQRFEIGEEGIEGIPLAESARQHLVGLEVGETTRPFELGSSTWWLHIAELNQPEGKSIYDPEVQRSLRYNLRNRRYNEEMERYSRQLFERGVFDEQETMIRKLFEIANRRYGP